MTIDPPRFSIAVGICIVEELFYEKTSIFLNGSLVISTRSDRYLAIENVFGEWAYPI